ncbi:MAG: DUF1460 domain-containing protein [Oscillatoria princeps RMCB-10]|nr:DUF1460 domain-containing protein [Oscillatoria princeps RMCB-10]
MKKILGLAVLGFLLACAGTLRKASEARVMEPCSVACAPALSQTLADKSFPSETASSRKIPTSPPAPAAKGGDLPATSAKDDNLSSPSPIKTHRHDLGELAQVPYVRRTEEVARFQSLMQHAQAEKLHERPMSEILQALAEQLLGAEYTPGLLDKSNTETLVVSLTQFDCVLFVETVLAMARGVAVRDYSYDSFVSRIADLRYRNGKLNGYCSRLHYFSDWIFDNEKRGTVANITRALGGVPLNKTLNFMSRHKSSYPQMASDDATYQCIVGAEARLDGLRVDYIPQSQIRRAYAQLQPGDIVAIATEIEGLDVTHTGLVYRSPDGSTGLIHASPSGAVKISPDLETYVGKVESSTGILLARPADPRALNP